MNDSAPPDRSRWILAVLATDPDFTWDLPRLRLVVFVIGKRLSPSDYFRFVAHAYGPFEPSVGRVAEALCGRGEALREGKSDETARYVLSETGAERAGALTWTEAEGAVIAEVSDWIRQRPYTEVLTDVYRQWPEIRLQGLSGYVPGHSL